LSLPGESIDAVPSRNQAVAWVGAIMLAFAGLAVFLTLAAAFRAPGVLPMTVWVFAFVNLAVAAAGLGLLVSRQEGIRIVALALCAVKAAAGLYSIGAVLLVLSHRGAPRDLYLPSLGWGLAPLSVLVFAGAVLILSRNLNAQ